MNPPPPPSPCQFFLLGVPNRHFQHQLWGNLEQLGVIAVGLEQEWQDVEAAPWGFPALLDADLQPEVARSHHCYHTPGSLATAAGGGGTEIPVQAGQWHFPLEALGHVVLAHWGLPDGKKGI